MRYRNLLACTFFIVGAFATASSVLAQDLVITAPANGAVLPAGAQFVVTARQRAGLSPIHFNLTVAAVGTRGLEVSALEAIEPYTFRAKLPPNAIGTYQIHVFARRVGESSVFSLPVTITAQPPQFASIVAANGGMALGFPGDTGDPLRAFGITPTGDRIAIPDGFLTFVSADPNVAQVKDGRPIGTASGTTQILLTYGNFSASVGVTVAAITSPGDFNSDGVVDQRDLDYLTRFLNMPAASSSDARDLNRDGKINALDLRVLTGRCTHPRCAVQ